MTHFSDRLPEELELGAVRREEWGTRTVETDGGWEQRNNRWSNPKRTYQVSFPPSARDGTVYLEVKALFTKCEGALHSFDFVDWTDETGATVVPVRFDTALELTALTGWLDHIETLTLKEVFL